MAKIDLKSAFHIGASPQGRLGAVRHPLAVPLLCGHVPAVWPQISTVYLFNQFA